jgi:hypothetical protein
LQGDICAQGLSKAYHEELNLMILRDGRVTAGQGHEPRTKVVDEAFTPEKSELADRAVVEQRPEPDLNELDEMIP